MLAAEVDPSLGVVLGALLGAVGLLATAIFTSRSTRSRIGKPNGSGSVVTMLESALESLGALKSDVAEVKFETQKNRAEIVVARGMIEAEAALSREHRDDDQRNFEMVFEEQARVAAALGQAPDPQRETA